MYLDEILKAQKRGEAKGIPSVCSAHPYVIKQTLRVCQTLRASPLIEATCNQVNQFGGYTGMTPAKFVDYVRGIAEEVNYLFENIILGGDHLGPSVWQDEPAESAMDKAKILVCDYVLAGFTKIHLDCSMKLGNDPKDVLDVEVSAKRAVELAKVAEQTLAKVSKPSQGLRYIIGTEVPIPGGAGEHEETVSVTKVEDARQTIEVTREAFVRAGLESVWERVVGVVVQPGVEFGDDFVIPYQPEKAQELSKFIASQSLVYEAHSTDYQTREALTNLVRDHFAILKVGPALTFAFREAVFALAMMENELLPVEERSNIIAVLDEVMLKKPAHWQKYYHGSEAEQAFKRKYSLSDRVRYYWAEPGIQQSLKQLLAGLSRVHLPMALLKQYVPDLCTDSEDQWKTMTGEQILSAKIKKVLDDYYQACVGK